MKKSWWKVPLYCMVASWICFQLEIRFLGRWAIVTLPDGSISSDNTRWMLMSAGLFLAVVCIGGFFLFRKMTRKEIFFSSSALVALNIYILDAKNIYIICHALEWTFGMGQCVFSDCISVRLKRMAERRHYVDITPIYFSLVWQERSSYRLMKGGNIG